MLVKLTVIAALILGTQATVIERTQATSNDSKSNPLAKRFNPPPKYEIFLYNGFSLHGHREHHHAENNKDPPPFGHAWTECMEHHSPVKGRLYSFNFTATNYNDGDQILHFYSDSGCGSNNVFSEYF
ncbi:hypothetical protein BJ138DRAFT_809787 [Hygrophoropsis aurantiaca]|uniref:Uncharacterized protein n=1 Tax=Hygrophoropsis aurantiaca TaxID=72124 RepID=A0ACB8AH56_9AGAM|nr:hypothetical protein BJ138DRAFT_809787 [Hygrophoropsis aurantiaca]